MSADREAAKKLPQWNHQCDALLAELDKARDALTRLWVVSIPPSDLALKLWRAEWIDNPTPEMKEWMANYEQAYGDVRELLRAGEE